MSEALQLDEVVGSSEPPRRRGPWRFRAAGALAVWTCAVLLGGAQIALDAAIPLCLPRRGFVDGRPGWSIVPPGPTCTFTKAVNGYDAVTGPSWTMSIWLATVVAGAAFLVWKLRGRRSGWWVGAVVASVTWSLLLLVGAALLALIELVGDTYCSQSPDGSSTPGALGWSILPPGPTCTFTKAANGYDATNGPSWATTIWIVALISGAAVVRGLIRRSKGPLVS